MRPCRETSGSQPSTTPNPWACRSFGGTLPRREQRSAGACTHLRRPHDPIDQLRQCRSVCAAHRRQGRTDGRRMPSRSGIGRRRREAPIQRPRAAWISAPPSGILSSRDRSSTGRHAPSPERVSMSANSTASICSRRYFISKDVHPAPCFRQSVRSDCRSSSQSPKGSASGLLSTPVQVSSGCERSRWRTTPQSPSCSVTSPSGA